MKIFCLVQLLAMGLCVYGAEIMRLDAESDTLDVTGRGITFTDKAHSGKKAYICPKRVDLRSKASFKIKPDAYYVISAWVKTADEKPNHVFFGLVPYSNTGAYIAQHHFSPNPEVITELVKPAEKGDTTITVKSAAKWRRGRVFVVAFNAAADGSDIPNRDTSSTIASMKRNTPGGDVITLTKPLTKSYPAGTKVRQHQLGGHHYLKRGEVTPGEWTKWESAKVKGSSIRKAGQALVTLVINVDKKYREGTLLVDDIVVEEFEN